MQANTPNARLRRACYKLAEAMDRLPLGAGLIANGYAFHLLLGDLVASPILEGRDGRILGGWMRAVDMPLDDAGKNALAELLEKADASRDFVNVHQHLKGGSSHRQVAA